MKQLLFILIPLILCNHFASAQEEDKLFTATKNGINKPSTLSVHPFGIFISRIQGNFKIRPNDKPTLNINLESGNVWGAPVKTYIPNDEVIRNQVRDHHWDQAQYFFDVEHLDAESYELQIDGIIKGLRADVTFGLNKKHEINIGVRMFMLTKGKFPFSIFTNDEFIEFFHENIGGGSDPFDRKVFGLNKAKIEYNDRNGNTLELNAGDFFIGGIELGYFYYPKISISKNLYFNFGTHLGINLSKYNTSIDIGLSSNAIKIFNLTKKSDFAIGLSLGANKKSFTNFKNDNIDFGTHNFIGHLESALEYSFVTKKGLIHSFGADFYLQTPLNHIEEKDYMIAVRHPDSHNAWGHGVTNLYKFNDYWTFFYSLTKKNIVTLYLQQDFTVNNNPDLQTGIRYSFSL